MKFEVIGTIGGSAAVQIHLSKGESVKAESDAMVSRSGGIEVSSKMEGGVISSLARRCLTGESIFFQTLLAHEDGTVLLAPKFMGSIHICQMGNGTGPLLLRQGVFLCAEDTVSITSTTQKSCYRGCCSGQGFFLLRASGEGKLAINSIGTIVRYQLKPLEIRVVDNGHVVAFSENIKWHIARQGQTVLGSMTSGEGLGCFFEGPGEIIVQTHTAVSIASTMSEKRDTVSSSSSCLQYIWIIITCTIVIGAYLIENFIDDIRDIEKIGRKYRDAL